MRRLLSPIEECQRLCGRQLLEPLVPFAYSCQAGWRPYIRAWRNHPNGRDCISIEIAVPGAYATGEEALAAAQTKIDLYREMRSA